MKFIIRIGIFVFATSLVLSNVCIKSGISIWFLCNRTTIETELCEQKEVVNNCCKGSCVLEKKMEEADSAESNPILPGFRKLPELSAYTPVAIMELEFVVQESTTTPFAIFKTETRDISNSIFRPPCC